MILHHDGTPQDWPRLAEQQTSAEQTDDRELRGRGNYIPVRRPGDDPSRPWASRGDWQAISHKLAFRPRRAL